MWWIWLLVSLVSVWGIGTMGTWWLLGKQKPRSPFIEQFYLSALWPIWLLILLELIRTEVNTPEPLSFYELETIQHNPVRRNKL